MGGVAGRYLIDEYRRGACGTMPACEATDVHVQVWEALEAGDERRARDLFNRLLPLLNFEARMPGVYKAGAQAARRDRLRLPAPLTPGIRSTPTTARSSTRSSPT